MTRTITILLSLITALIIKLAISTALTILTSPLFSAYTVLKFAKLVLEMLTTAPDAQTVSISKITAGVSNLVVKVTNLLVLEIVCIVAPRVEMDWILVRISRRSMGKILCLWPLVIVLALVGILMKFLVCSWEIRDWGWWLRLGMTMAINKKVVWGDY